MSSNRPNFAKQTRYPKSNKTEEVSFSLIISFADRLKKMLQTQTSLCTIKLYLMINGNIKDARKPWNTFQGNAERKVNRTHLSAKQSALHKGVNANV